MEPKPAALLLRHKTHCTLSSAHFETSIGLGEVGHPNNSVEFRARAVSAF